MCGFVGYIDKEIGDYKANALNLSKMTQKIHSRGPDDEGTWIDEIIGVALDKRLSILDVSNSGKQPMVSKSGRFVIVFNGEIYNHLELRKEQKVFAIIFGGRKF